MRGAGPQRGVCPQTGAFNQTAACFKCILFIFSDMETVSQREAGFRRAPPPPPPPGLTLVLSVAFWRRINPRDHYSPQFHIKGTKSHNACTFFFLHRRHRRLLLASSRHKFLAPQTMRATEWEPCARGRTLCFHRGCPVRRRIEQT